MARAFQIYTSLGGINEVSDETLRRIAEQAAEAGERVTTYTFDIVGEAEYGEAVFLEYAGRLAISWSDAVIWIEAPTAQSGVMTWLKQEDWPNEP
jgi:hypothetical protein